MSPNSRRPGRHEYKLALVLAFMLGARPCSGTVVMLIVTSEGIVAIADAHTAPFQTLSGKALPSREHEEAEARARQIHFWRDGD